MECNIYTINDQLHSLLECNFHLTRNKLHTWGTFTRAKHFVCHSAPSSASV